MSVTPSHKKFVEQRKKEMDDIIVINKIYELMQLRLIKILRR